MPKNEETAAFLCRRVRSTTCSTSVPVAVMRVVVVYVVVYVVYVVRSAFRASKLQGRVSTEEKKLRIFSQHKTLNSKR